MPPQHSAYDRSLKDAPRDLKQAKKLLAQAGYPDGFSLSLWAMSVQRPSNPNARLWLKLKAQKIFKRGQPLTPIVYATDYPVINKRVTGFKINPFGATIFSIDGVREKGRTKHFPKP